MTRARSLVLGILEAALEPLSAAGVAERCGDACDQATVYRALSFLEKEGLSDSFVLRCEAHGTERYFSSALSGHRHWFHCERCHRFLDLGACTLGGFVSETERRLGVRVRAHALHLSGLCADCASLPGAGAKL